MTRLLRAGESALFLLGVALGVGCACGSPDGIRAPARPSAFVVTAEPAAELIPPCAHSAVGACAVDGCDPRTCALRVCLLCGERCP